MVIFIDESIFEKQKFGGISRYFCELASAIVDSPEHEVVIYAGWSRNAYLEKCVPSGNFRVIRVSRFLRKLEFAKDWLNPLLRKFHFLGLRLKHRNKALVYHPSYFRLDSVAAKFSDVSVLSVFDLIYENRKGRKRLKKINRRKRLQSKVDRIITISESTARDLAVFNPEVKEKISVIHLASSVSQNAEVNANQDSNGFFLFVGTRGGYKNGILAIEAFARLQQETDRELQLIFAGGGSFKRDELDLIQRYGLEDQILQKDMSDQALLDAYCTAIALVYPSSYEGFGLPLLEAMQVDCPVITQEISSMPEVVGAWGNYMSDDSSEALLCEMRSMLLPKDEEQMAEREVLRQEQLSKFSWRKTADKTLQVYESLQTSSSV